jgi:hypothetical protein
MMVFSICIVLASTGFIGALSTPVSNTIIVSFDRTEAETAAIDILQEKSLTQSMYLLEDLNTTYLKCEPLAQ